MLSSSAKISVFRRLRAVIYEYVNGSFEDHPNNADPSTVDSDAFNIMCVIDKIRVAMLYSSVEYEGTGKTPKIFEDKMNKLQKEVAQILPPDVVLKNDNGDFYVMQQNFLPKFLASKTKTDILGLCTFAPDIFYRFSFNGRVFMTNGCSEKEGLSVFTKQHAMFQEMKKLAAVLKRGKVTLEMKFE